MPSDNAADDDFIPPYIHLQSSLDVYEEEHEQFYRAPVTPEERALDDALGQVAEHAIDLLRSGRVPDKLAALLESYEPWRPLTERVNDLLWYDYCLRRIEFDIARDRHFELSS